MMSRAMGRSLPNILFSAFGSVITATGGAEGDTTRSVRSASAEDVAILLAYANKVIVVPGYGLAVAQAQHTIRELADLLESRGVQVIYAIHPVAGRMPGHMNVLLAEANVPYEQLKEMDEANPEFQSADVASWSAPTTSSTRQPRTTRTVRSTGCPSLPSTKPATSCS